MPLHDLCLGAMPGLAYAQCSQTELHGHRPFSTVNALPETPAVIWQ